MFGSRGIGTRQCKGPEVGVCLVGPGSRAEVGRAGVDGGGGENEIRGVSGPDLVDLVGLCKDLGSQSESIGLLTGLHCPFPSPFSAQFALFLSGFFHPA